MNSILFTGVFLVVFQLKCHTVPFKNCSYFKPFTSKKEYKLCYDELVCCDKPKSESEVCCSPPEYQTWNTVLPVQLNLQNIIFVIFIFFGVIISGATVITILMGISAFMEKQKLYKPVFIYNPVNSRDTIHVPVEYQRHQASIF